MLYRGMERAQLDAAYNNLAAVATPRGGRWHDRTVARLLDRLHLR
jgi:hypothetical protein